nr:hypothetical protein [Taibaiella sp. KBW10]
MCYSDDGRGKMMGNNADTATTADTKRATDIFLIIIVVVGFCYADRCFCFHFTVAFIVHVTAGYKGEYQQI